MQRILILFLLLLTTAGCALSTANNPPSDLSGYDANKSNINISDGSPPEWFVNEDPENFDFIIKNAEMSSSKVLAERKNILISEILLANKIQTSFMTANDQKTVINSIRNASKEDDLKKYSKNKLVNDIIKGYSIIKNETLKYETGHINYIYIKKIKK